MALLREIKLDTDGDLAIEGGEMVLVSGVEALAQRIQTRLRAFRGEWIFDQNVGTPWLGQIIGARPNLDLIRTILTRRISETEGVARVESMTLDFDRSTRVLTGSAKVKAENEDGDVTVPLSLEV